MAHTQTPGISSPPTPFLSERDNQRAVDLIEEAERSAPYCLCGAHMIAVGHGDAIWLECAQLGAEKKGISSVLARLTAFSHTRRMIMELPAAA